MGSHDARNVGRMGARSPRRRAIESHYLSAREARLIGTHVRRKNEKRGIFRRWGGRKLTPEQEKLAAAARKRVRFRGKLRQPQKPKPKPKP